MSKVRPYKGKDVFLDYVSAASGEEYRRTPRNLIDSLEFAREALNYSNYDCHNFERIEEIVRRYCEEHSIPLGLSKKQHAHIKQRKHDAEMKRIQKRYDDLEKKIEGLSKK